MCLTLQQPSEQVEAQGAGENTQDFASTGKPPGQGQIFQDILRWKIQLPLLR